MSTKKYVTKGGITVVRTVTRLPLSSAMDGVRTLINNHRGAILASGYEDPDRYSRWDIGFVDPPVEIVARQREFIVRALNQRGERLLEIIGPILKRHEQVESVEAISTELRGVVKLSPGRFAEEERSKQPTIFSVLRALLDAFYSPADKHLGLYGAFGYDLVFQFEPINLHHIRSSASEDIHLFLLDELVVIDHRQEQARKYQYDFIGCDVSTAGLPRQTEEIDYQAGEPTPVACDHAPGEYADKVRRIIDGAKRGDFFEVVLSQVFSAGFPGTPLELFDLIRRLNPSPYEFLINLGKEQLAGASPEMFVRVEGRVVETCPISGTVRRGRTAMEDADQILKLLNSEKDKAELTMCTDVDRNDKSRICKPGTVKLIGRRMLELYARVIHTVDHVIGELRDDCDCLDAFLSHMWAGTLTGAPKPAAMQKVEELENSARGWYGAAVGFFLFNGDINTGITIRTVYLKDGIASIRVGATLLYDSEPKAEDQETRDKAGAFLDAVLGRSAKRSKEEFLVPQTGAGKRVLLVDNRDSFVHTLGNYIRQTGAEVITIRAPLDSQVLDEINPSLVFISPGPGTPRELGVPELVKECVKRNLPIFGVCLGLQGMVEAFGGELAILPTPAHGKSSKILCRPIGILAGFPEIFEAGRFHSIHALIERMPACLTVLARTEDGVVMAVQDKTYPAAAVQFHPESILTLKDDLGLRLIAQVIEQLAK